MAKKHGNDTYTQKVADEICERISVGETLQSICRDERMPAWRTVYDWMDKHDDFAASIAHARELGYDAIAEEALRIADTPMEGQKVVTDKNGKRVEKDDMLGHRKLQIETRLKLLAKWSPKKYGDRMDVTSDGKAIPAPIIRLANTDDTDN